MIRLHVDGDPRSKGSLRPIVSGNGRLRAIESGGDNLRLWRETLTAALRPLGMRNVPITGPVGVFLHFQLRPPKRRVRWYPTAKPDIDKLARCVLDHLTSAPLIGDDAQVTLLVATKRYGTPGVEIVIAELDQLSGPDLGGLLLEGQQVRTLSEEVVRQVATAR